MKHRLKRRAIQDSRLQENVSSKSDLLSLDDLLEGLGEAKSGTKPKVKQLAKKEGRYSRPGVKGPKFKEEMIPAGSSRDPKSTDTDILQLRIFFILADPINLPITD